MLNKVHIKHWQNPKTYTMYELDKKKVTKHIKFTALKTIGALLLILIGIEESLLQTLIKLGLGALFNG